MKNIKHLFSIELLRKTSGETMHRFPISTIYMALVAVLLFTLSHGFFSSTEEERIVLVILSVIVGFFLSVGLYLGTEGHPKRTILQLFPIVFSILFYFGFGASTYDIENFVLFSLTLAGIIAYIFFSPYLKKIVEHPIKEIIFYSYFYKISIVFLTSFVLGGVLFALGAIGITATQVLFDIGYSNIDNFYGDWAIIALSILAPFFGLAQLPQKSSFSKADFIENRFFSFLVKYIAIPFIVIYFIILYLYTIKVLLNFSDWPKGEVTWLVIGFSTFGYLTYIFSYAFAKTEHIITSLRKVFPYIVFPQIFMLFYAIYLRVAQYDITINRYFVIVFGLWLFGLSLYYIISKNKRLIVIPASLTAITLIISIGPWSVYNLPESRQLARLETNLIEAKVLQNGKITPLSSENDISQELSKEIYGGIDYLCDFNNCEKIKELFPKIYNDIEAEDREAFEKQKQEDIERYNENLKDDNPRSSTYYKDALTREYQGPNSWTIVRKLTDTLKVYRYLGNNFESLYTNITLNFNSSFFPIDLNGYSEIFELDNYGRTSMLSQIDYASSKLEIYKNNTVYKEYDISIVLQKLEEIQSKDIGSDGIDDPELLIFELDGAKLFLQSIQIKNKNYTENGNSGAINNKEIPDFAQPIQGYILIK